MGIEEQIDRLIDLGEDIKSRLDRLIEQGVMLKQPVGDRFVLPPESEMNSITFGEAIEKAKRHFADASKMVVDEPAKKPEPAYREPVLPADAGQPCEFSMTEKDWYPSLLSGFQVHNNPWISSNLGRWNFARIKKEA